MKICHKWRENVEGIGTAHGEKLPAQVQGNSIIGAAISYPSPSVKTRKRPRSGSWASRESDSAIGTSKHRYGTRSRCNNLPSQHQRSTATSASVPRELSGQSTVGDLVEIMQQVSSEDPTPWSKCELADTNGVPNLVEQLPGNVVDTDTIANFAAGQVAAMTETKTIEHRLSEVSETLAAGASVPGGGSLGYRRKGKSRLSLKRRRYCQDQGSLGHASSPREVSNSTVEQVLQGSPVHVMSRDEGDRTHDSPPLAANISSSCSVDEATDSHKISCQRPPFVGLRNLGNSCYINAVVQALLACPGLVAKLRCGHGAAIPRRLHEGQTDAPEETGRVESCLSAESTVGSTITAEQTGLEFGTSQKTVLGELATLLMRMEDHNKKLSLNDGFGNISTGSDMHEGTTANKASKVVDSVCMKWLPSQTSSHSHRVPRQGAPCVYTLVPSGVVGLIRRGHLNPEANVFGSSCLQRGGRISCEILEDNGLTLGFGDGQQCASELLGKLFAAKASISDQDSAGDYGGTQYGRGGSLSVEEGASVGADFRGVLCTRTLCLECERDRVTREVFAELAVPPMHTEPPQEVSGAFTEGREPRDSGRISQTLQGLVETVLGTESLGGTDKVWCGTCRQWTEAKRRTSFHTLPRLLALHIRPTAGGDSPVKFTLRPESGVVGQNLLKTGCTANLDDARIERRLTVKAALRCHFHTDAKETQSWDETSQSQPCDDVHFDLIGVILHKGRTTRSGHYTFALHTRSAADDGLSKINFASLNPHTPRDSASHGMMSADDVNGKANENTPDHPNGVEASPRFVLFDDDRVRWLSTQEGDTILRGGGGGDELGNAFLVFYARQDAECG